jgi:hypothetical protein
VWVNHSCNNMSHVSQSTVHKYATRVLSFSFTFLHTLFILTTMPFDDFLRRIHVKKHADAEAREAHCSTGRQKEVLAEPRPFTHLELESYLEHFKTCKYLHFPDPQVRYYRKFSRTCKLHADYIRSFDNTVLIEICCGELIPYADYAKLGHEEHSCEPTFVFIADWTVLLHGNHIPGFRHIYLELDEAFKTSKR